MIWGHPMVDVSNICHARNPQLAWCSSRISIQLSIICIWVLTNSASFSDEWNISCIKLALQHILVASQSQPLNELTCSLKCTVCVWTLINESIHDSTNPRIPSAACRWLIMMSWLTISNAANKSSKPNRATSPWLLACKASETIFSTAVAVE